MGRHSAGVAQSEATAVERHNEALDLQDNLLKHVAHMLPQELLDNYSQALYSSCMETQMLEKSSDSDVKIIEETLKVLDAVAFEITEELVYRCDRRTLKSS